MPKYTNILLLLLLLIMISNIKLIEAGRGVKVPNNHVMKLQLNPESVTPKINYGDSATEAYKDRHVGPEESGNSPRGGGH